MSATASPSDLRSSLLKNKSKEKKKNRVTYNDSAESSPPSQVPFATDPLRNYDYCVVFRRQDYSNNKIKSTYNDRDEISEIGKVYLDHLTLVGINWILVSSLSKKYIYILLKAKIHVLHQLAMDLEYQLLLDPNVLKEIAEAGDVENGILPIKIQHVPQESHLFPYEHIYAPYRRDPDLNPAVYWKPPNLDNPFRELVRMKLTKLLIETQLLVPTISSPDLQSSSSPQTISTSDGAISIRNAISNGHMVAFFPLHHQSREHLARMWLPPFLFPWNYPMDEIRVISSLFLPLDPSLSHFPLTL
jgi:hypothetical protein